MTFALLCQLLCCSQRQKWSLNLKGRTGKENITHHKPSVLCDSMNQAAIYWSSVPHHPNPGIGGYDTLAPLWLRYYAGSATDCSRFSCRPISVSFCLFVLGMLYSNIYLSSTKNWDTQNQCRSKNTDLNNNGIYIIMVIFPNSTILRTWQNCSRRFDDRKRLGLNYKIM